MCADAPPFFRWANERLAQAGVFIEIDPDPDPNQGSIRYVNQPAEVDVADDGLELDNPPGDLSDEQISLFDKYGTEDTNDIVVFYVNMHDDLSTGAQTRAGLFPREYPHPRHLNNITIAALGGANHKTVAHELLHVLMNAAHDGSPRPYIFFGTATSVNHVTEGRRLSVDHANAILASQFVEDPA